MPDFDPEGSRLAVHSKGRTIVHYCHRLSGRARAQDVEQFRNKRLELIELNQHCIVRDLRGRQINRVAGFKQQPGLSLMVALLNDGHGVIKPQLRLSLKTKKVVVYFDTGVQSTDFSRLLKKGERTQLKL